MTTADLPGGGTPLNHEDCERLWRGWTPGEIARRLSGVRAHWYVAAGWALDLFRGGQTREHEDLEIGVPRGYFGEIAEALPGYEWDVVGAGKVWPYEQAGGYPDLHQTWLRDPGTGQYHLDVFREPHDGGIWVCRRDAGIRLPYEDLILWTETEDGVRIPYAIPEVVLLFKARDPRPKDEADFAGVLPSLDEERKARLAGWLDLVHPSHHWLASLAT
ncbi:nucleotidyltransferase domain-containing protein [Longispora albida]|uniref:nucleotidyltransferase domain-containing protein n=1 Tax=Longispora albida TaxID=203523 RepID=UPI00037D5976|nr:hypothetical protein [Longispora albida]